MRMRTKFYTQEEFAQAISKAAEFEGKYNAVLDPMIITDEDGVILYANDALSQVTGFSVNEILGRTPGEIWGNERDQGFYEEMWHTIKIEKRPFSSNVLNKKKDGTYYNCDLKIYPVLNQNKNINFFVGIVSNFEYAI